MNLFAPLLIGLFYFMSKRPRPKNVFFLRIPDITPWAKFGFGSLDFLQFLRVAGIMAWSLSVIGDDGQGVKSAPIPWGPTKTHVGNSRSPWCVCGSNSSLRLKQFLMILPTKGEPGGGLLRINGTTKSTFDVGDAFFPSFVLSVELSKWIFPRMPWNYFYLKALDLYPHPETVTTRIIPFFRLGNPNLNLHLWPASWVGGRPNECYMYILPPRCWFFVEILVGPTNWTRVAICLRPSRKNHGNVRVPQRHLRGHYINTTHLRGIKVDANLSFEGFPSIKVVLSLGFGVCHRTTGPCLCWWRKPWTPQGVSPNLWVFWGPGPPKQILGFLRSWPWALRWCIKGQPHDVPWTLEVGRLSVRRGVGDPPSRVLGSPNFLQFWDPNEIQKGLKQRSSVEKWWNTPSGTVRLFVVCQWFSCSVFLKGDSQPKRKKRSSHMSFSVFLVSIKQLTNSHSHEWI